VCCVPLPDPAARLEGRRAQVYGRAPGRLAAQVSPGHPQAAPERTVALPLTPVERIRQVPGPVSLKPKSPPANSDLPIIGQCSCIQP
jgi:hypothetical protein